MSIQYFNRGGCWLRRHPPLKILDAHPFWHHRRWAKQKIKKSHLLFSKSLTPFLKNNISILKQTVRETQKWHQKFDRVSVFELLIKTIFCMFWSLIQDPLGLLKCLTFFSFFFLFCFVLFCFVLFCFVLFLFVFLFFYFIALLLEAGGWREVTETTTSPLLHSQLYNPDIHA